MGVETALTKQVVVEDHSELGQLHGPGSKLHCQHVTGCRETVSRHPEVAWGSDWVIGSNRCSEGMDAIKDWMDAVTQ